MKSKLGILFALVLGLAITGSTFAQNKPTMSSKDTTANSKVSSKTTAKNTAKKYRKHRKHHHTAKRMRTSRKTKGVQGS